MANIVIIGGGFGGLIVAENLHKSLNSSHQITLVSPNQRFTFYPALVHLALGECDADEITFDLRAKLADMGVRFIQGEMLRMHPDRGTIEIAGPDLDGELAYDYLVLAAGRRLATEKIPGFFEHANHLLGVNAARRFGEAVRDFKAGTIIVGSCPDARLPVPVCETAFALARKFEGQIREGSIRVKVIFPESLSAAFGGADLHKELESAFERHGINLLYDIPISEITSDSVISSKGHAISYDLLMLVPPFRGQSVLNRLGITDESDYIRVDAHMKVHGLERTYAVGDVVAFSGPKFAHMAVRQAEIAAVNIASEIDGKDAWEEYYHEIATIIDSGGSDSIYLHYGIWDDTRYRLKKGKFWSLAKDVHDAAWRAKHK